MKHLQLATTAQVALTLCLVASSAAANESSRRRDGQSAPPPAAPLVRTAGLDDGRTQNPVAPRTRVSIRQGRWFLNDAITYRGAKAEGLLMNVRAVNAVFEDANRPEFDPGANTESSLPAFLTMRHMASARSHWACRVAFPATKGLLTPHSIPTVHFARTTCTA